MTDPTLHPVLDRASDGVRPALSPRHAASAALARAHVVRRRRRAVTAAGAVAAAVVVTTALLGVPGTDRSEQSATVPTAPPARGVAAADVQAELDPRTLGGLPRRDSVLPATLAPPAAGTRVAGLPLDGPARLVLAQGRGRLLLLGEDGRWAATRTPSGDSVASGMSADGTMLAATGPHGLWVVDVRDGEWRELALPDEPAPPWTSRGTRVQWQGDDRVVLTDVGQFLALPTDAGTPVRTSPAGRRVVPVTGFVPLGADRALVLGGNRGGGGAIVAEIEDGRLARVVPTGELGELSRPVVSEGWIAGTVAGIPREDRPTDRAGVLAARRGTDDATAYLPLAGTRYRPALGEDQPGGITTWGWLDADTVLLGTEPRRNEPWRLVAWDVTSGAVSLVATGNTGTRLVAVAEGLLGR